MSYKYNARVYCEGISKGEYVRYNFEGFDNPQDGAKWIAKKFSQLMVEWGEIDDNGIAVVGEVFDENETEFSDIYELKCGI